MTAPHSPSAAVAVPSVDDDAIARRLTKPALRPNNGRRMATVVTGFGAVFFGILTIALVASGVIAPGRWAGVALLAAFTASMGSGMAFLSSRFARGLPPFRFLASADELDHLDG
jgi:hypothetical protein